MTSRSEFVDIITPLRERLRLYDPTRSPTDQPKNDAADPAKAVPQSFIDAMVVREEVYVREQKIALENEFDEDDGRSYHWVAYASIPSKQNHSSPPLENNNSSSSTSSSARRKTSSSTKIPIGTIRIVPPPHPAAHAGSNGQPHSSTLHGANEPFVKIGRLAVIKEFRKAGISRLLIETALAYVRDHAADLMPHADPSKMEALTQGLHDSSSAFGGAGAGAVGEFRGLVLAHSQIGTQKVWVRYGFVTDESMGTWDEEGIEHVGMWKRVDVSSGRRKSRVTLN